MQKVPEQKKDFGDGRMELLQLPMTHKAKSLSLSGVLVAVLLFFKEICN